MIALIESNPPLLILAGFLIASIGWIAGATAKHVSLRELERRAFREAEFLHRIREEEARRDALPTAPRES